MTKRQGGVDPESAVTVEIQQFIDLIESWKRDRQNQDES